MFVRLLFRAGSHIALCASLPSCYHRSLISQGNSTRLLTAEIMRRKWPAYVRIINPNRQFPTGVVKLFCANQGTRAIDEFAETSIQSLCATYLNYVKVTLRWIRCARCILYARSPASHKLVYKELFVVLSVNTNIS